MLARHASTTFAFWVLLATSCLVPLVSWEGFFFGVAFTKTIVFFLGVLTALVFWIGSAIWRRPTSIVGAIALFVVVVGIAAVVGIEPSQSIWSNYERMFGFVTYLFGLAYIIMLTDLLRHEYYRKLFLSAVVSVGVLVAGIAVVQFLIDSVGSRPTSTIYNSAFLGSYLLLLIFPALYLGLAAKEKTIKYAWFFAATLIVLGVFVSGARAAILGSIAGLLVLTVGLLRHKGKMVRHCAIGFLVFLLVGAGVFFLLREQLANAPIVFVRRLARISIEDPSVSSRFLGWQVAWEGWKDRPVFGWGPENFNILFSEHYDARLVNFEPWFDRAHNFIFDIGSMTGLAGLLAYMGIFGVASVTLWRLRAHRWFAITFGATGVAYLVEHLFTFDSISSFVLLLALCAYIVSHTETSNKGQGKYSISRMVVVAMLALAASYIVIWRPVQENYMGRSAYELLAQGRDEEAAALFEKALSYRTYGDIDVRRAVAEYVFECAKAWDVCGSKRSVDKQAYILDYAIEKMEENINTRPRDIKWHMYQGQLYRMRSTLSSPPDRALAALAEKRFSEAREVSPGRAQNYLEIALARKLQGNYEGMWSILEEGERRAPEYLIIQYNIHSHAVDLSDQRREQEALKKIYDEQGNPQYDLLRDAYVRNKRYSDAIDMQSRWIDIRSESLSNKDAAPLYQQLAALFRVVGDNQKAREAALKVRELDPSLSREVDAFLSTLR
ncbi:MAG: O-antigen ligase family protein [Patescibacteria group bacterium]